MYPLLQTTDTTGYLSLETYTRGVNYLYHYFSRSVVTQLTFCDRISDNRRNDLWEVIMSAVYKKYANESRTNIAAACMNSAAWDMVQN